MTTTDDIHTLPDFDITELLQSEQDIAEYLQVVLEDGDAALLAATLGDIARARGMTQLAHSTGLSRASLYKSLSGERAPRSDTLLKIIRAMGYRLCLEPIESHTQAHEAVRQGWAEQARAVAAMGNDELLMGEY